MLGVQSESVSDFRPTTRERSHMFAASVRGQSRLNGGNETMNTRTRISGAVGAVLVVAAGVTVYAVTGGNDSQSRHNAIGSVKVAYPDTDFAALKTTGGFLGNTNQYNASTYS